MRTRLLPEVFAGNPTAATLGSGKTVRSIQWGSDVYVVGNFSASATETATLPDGTWYDYYADGAKESNHTITLAPGELKIYTGKQLRLPSVPDGYSFETDIDEATDTTPSPKAVKVLRNGQIYILRNGVGYDLMGRRLFAE